MPEREYPVYVQLHGLWDVAAERLRYLAYPYSNAGTSFAFEDGYLISPWGRGNLWYRGIAETDVWEGLAAVKGLVRVDAGRQYLCGHSMGGYGAWHIARSSADVWAALGIHAGALQYDPREVDATAAAALRDLPTYFVVGTSDGLLRREPGRPRAAPQRRQSGAGVRALLRRPRVSAAGRRADVPLDARVRHPRPPLAAAGPAHFRRVSRAPRSLSASDPKLADESTRVRAA